MRLRFDWDNTGSRLIPTSGGRVRLTSQWGKNQEGNDRYTTELIARDLLMLGGRDDVDSPSDTRQEPVTDSANSTNNDEITAELKGVMDAFSEKGAY